MENLQTKSEKQYYIPMEVNETSKEFIIANGYNLSTDAVCTKIGHRTVRAIMIPATKEQYLEYMRPLWREDKQGQRASKQEDESKMQPVSLDQLYESTEYEVSDGVDLEANLIKQEMIAELHAALDELEEMDRTIMTMFGDGATEKQIAEVVHLSQKGVNKRKKKVMVQLKTNLPKHDKEKRDAFVKYNIRDVEVELSIQGRLSKFPLPDFVWEEFWLDQEINDRGIAFDIEVAKNAIVFDKHSKDKLTAKIPHSTGIDNPNSVMQMKAWLSENGIEADSLDKKAVKELIASTPAHIREVLEIRQQLAKSSVKKYQERNQ